MFTSYAISDVEYYLEEAEKLRNMEAGAVLEKAQKAMLAGDFDDAADLLPEVSEAARAGKVEFVQAHIKALKRELFIASEQFDRDDRDGAAKRVAAVEVRLGVVFDAAKHKRDRMTYYVDGGTSAGEGRGTWWSPKLGQLMPMVDGGSEVSPTALRALARGEHPTTGKPMIQGNRPERKAGYDLQLSDPKSVSVLKAAAEMAGTMKDGRLLHELIGEAKQRSVRRALDFIVDLELVVTRRGKGGKNVEPVADFAIACFHHTTSRAGDPQEHDHLILMNAVVRKDGSTGTLDNLTILRYQRAIGAAYDTAMSAEMEGLGFAVEKDENTFKLAGVPADVTKLFSKRNNDIQAAAEEAGFATADDRGRARRIALSTRNKKDDVPERAELMAPGGLWEREMAGLGWSPAALLESASAARFRRDDDMIRASVDFEDAKPFLRKAAAEKAVAVTEEMEAVLERRHILKEVMDRMMGLGTVDEALAEITRMEADGKLVRVGTIEESNEPVYATPEMIEAERSIVTGSLERRGEREFVSPTAVNAAIARRGTMTEEQADAVRHSLNDDGVTVVEGFAGTGKSFSLGAVADAARDVGLHVFVVAMSHKAKGVIANDTLTDETSARAVAGMVARLSNADHKDHIKLTKRDLILIDEAGMVGTKDLAKVLAYARLAGAKVVLAGDTRQLQPVSAGAPMCVLAKLLGTQRIETIIRQSKSVHASWMIPASKDFATGHPDRAMEAYAAKGRLHLGKDAADTMARLAADWKAYVLAQPVTAKSHEDRLVVAGRTRDVTALNPLLREAYREAGRLKGEDVTIAAFVRGRDPKLADLKLAAGDRLIFGESVRVQGVEINVKTKDAVNNSDMATLTHVSKDADPIVHLVFDKATNGKKMEVTCRWSELVGYRAEDAPDSERHPIVQHGYAVTTHASQGSTVNTCLVYNGHGMGMESTYVAMTRHRHEAAMYVDTSRIVDRLESRKDVHTFAISSAGKGGGPDAELGDKELRTGGGYSDADLTKVLLHEVMRSESKRNISDFFEDKTAWAYDRPQPLVEADMPDLTAVVARQAAPRSAEDTAASMSALDKLVSQGGIVLTEPLMRSPFGPRFGTRPVNQEVRPSAVVEALVQRMASREEGPAYPVPDVPVAPFGQGHRTEAGRALIARMAERLEMPMDADRGLADDIEIVDGTYEDELSPPAFTIARDESHRLIDTAIETLKPAPVVVSRSATEAEILAAAETARLAAEAAARLADSQARSI
jgi:conjugative relaxase-like TrwC/TraI family protein